MEQWEARIQAAKRNLDAAEWELRLSVHQAVKDGVTRSEIQARTGIARTTINKYVDDVDAAES